MKAKQISLLIAAMPLECKSSYANKYYRSGVTLTEVLREWRRAKLGRALCLLGLIATLGAAALLILVMPPPLQFWPCFAAMILCIALVMVKGWQCKTVADDCGKHLAKFESTVSRCGFSIQACSNFELSAMRQLASSQLKDAMQRLEAATRNLNDAASDLQNPSLDMKDRVLQLHCSSRAYLERAEHLEKLRGDLIDLDLREPPPGTCLGKVERLECPNILGSEA